MLRFLLLLKTYFLFSVTGIGFLTRVRLVQTLENIYKDDQKYRQVNANMEIDPKEMALLDELNLIKVKAILDKNGWPDSLLISDPEHISLFLVIQHSDIQTQNKYLPVFKEAMSRGKLNPKHVAMLEDRIAVNEGKLQIYGSQIGQDPDSKEFFVKPMVDPKHVDERRLSMGMQPLSEYVKIWGISLEK